MRSASVAEKITPITVLKFSQNHFKIQTAKLSDKNKVNFAKPDLANGSSSIRPTHIVGKPETRSVHRKKQRKKQAKTHPPRRPVTVLKFSTSDGKKSSSGVLVR